MSDEETERLRVFARKVESIMDSICGAQRFNWSEHAYPLRAALEEAGYHGKGYEEARKELGTLIDEIARLRAAIDDEVEKHRVSRNQFNADWGMLRAENTNLRAALGVAESKLTRIRRIVEE
jgi:hypothetical protein